MMRTALLESELVDGNTRLTVTGVSAHASVPEKGKNAAKMLVHVLAKLGIAGAPIALRMRRRARVCRRGSGHCGATRFPAR